MNYEKIANGLPELIDMPVIEDSLKIEVGPMNIYQADRGDFGFRRVTLSMVVYDRNKVKEYEPLRVFSDFKHLIDEI